MSRRDVEKKRNLSLGGFMIFRLYRLIIYWERPVVLATDAFVPGLCHSRALYELSMQTLDVPFLSLFY